MSEVHTTVAGIVVNVPNNANGTHPLPTGAGQPITQTKNASGQVIKTLGQVPGTTVVHNKPA